MKGFCPILARLTGGTYDEFVIMNLHIDLVFEPALFEHWLGDANAP